MVVATLGLALVLPLEVQAKIFRCSAGDVPCLIDAINEANANGEVNTIRLAAGTYTLTAPMTPFPNPNGLPVITSSLTITGRGAETTIIERGANALGFRILQVATAGTLTLKRLTLRGGVIVGVGGGILNDGTLTLMHSAVIANGSAGCLGGGGIATSGTATIAHSTIADNLCLVFGGGLNILGGTVTLHASTVTSNVAQGGGGGIANGGFFGGGPPGGMVIITESAITHNATEGGGGGGGGIANNNGLMEIINTTIAANTSIRGNGVGLANFDGILLLTNSTVAENRSSFGVFGMLEALENDAGTVILVNTILANNGVDCHGEITSLTNNLIGDPTGCTITLQPSDLTGDPGLGPFTDNGRPGNGHFPLLPTSQAINAGNDALCPRTDQLGRRRIGPCDLGATEFRDRDDRHHEEDDKHDKEHDADPVAAAQASQ
jgi:hypothetical protein